MINSKTISSLSLIADFEVSELSLNRLIIKTLIKISLRYNFEKDKLIERERTVGIIISNPCNIFIIKKFNNVCSKYVYVKYFQQMYGDTYYCLNIRNFYY